ncbi:MAG: hypothetical protein OXU70_04190 [Gammaproteobacteria bacterium]|nr:hypothetical protein [Gammaproteobacteria bacterium]
MKKLAKALLFLILVPGLAGSQEPPTPWTDSDVVQTALDIGMNAEQLPQFRAAVTAFLEGRRTAFEEIQQSGQMSGIRRKMRASTADLREQMDADMAELLTEEQYPKYEAYRDLLMSKFRI